MNLVDRAKNIMVTPKTEWPVIAAEQPDPTAILTGYVIPLALIPAIATVIGWGVVGGPLHSGSLLFGIVQGIISLVSTVVGVYVTAYVVDLLAPNFASQRSLGRAMQLVAYSYTPAWVAGILHIVPVIGWLSALLGLYALYLMYLGFPYTMKTPQDKVVIYMIVAIVVLLVVYLIIGAILGGILMAAFGLNALGVM